MENSVKKKLEHTVIIKKNGYLHYLALTDRPEELQANYMGYKGMALTKVKKL